MANPIPYKEGKDFPKLPTRTPILVKVMDSKFETEKNPFAGEGEPEMRDVVKVTMEAYAPFLGARVWDKFSASIHERSRLRPFIQACHGTDLTLDQLKAFDTDTLAGCHVMVVGEYDDKRDPEHKWLRATSYLRVPATGAETPSPVATAATRSTTSSKAAVAQVDLDF